MNVKPTGLTHYVLEHGSYYLYDPYGSMRTMVDEIAIAYSFTNGDYCIHKHGNPEEIENWVKEHKFLYESSGMFENLSFVNATGEKKWKAEDINKCLSNHSCCAYLGVLLNTIEVEVTEVAGESIMIQEVTE